MPPTHPRPRIAIFALALALALAALTASSAAASPTLSQEEQQGEALAAAVRSGEKQCSDLSADDFELIGEYAMGRYLGSETAHAAMNRRMTLMMGEAGERRMHTALGYRYSRCAGGPSSAWVGPLAGMMGGGGSDGYGPGMMRGGPNNGDGAYSGSMMGSGHDGGDVSVVGAIVIALAAAAVGAGVATLIMQRQRPPEGAK